LGKKEQSLGSSTFWPFGNSIAGNAALSATPEPFYVSPPFVGVFGSTAFHPLPPPLPSRPGELAAHQDNHFAFPQPKLGLDGLKRRSVLPGHFNDSFNLGGRKINLHTRDNNVAALRF
jgi:hypothetical protein